MVSGPNNVHYRLYDYVSGISLVLDGCAATVHILDLHAVVILSQRFTVPRHWTSGIAGVYTLITVPGAAVCGFEMIRPDGSKVEGIVRDQEELTQAGEQSGAEIDQYMGPNTFSVNVGDILPSETIIINVRYIQPLGRKNANALVFTFPRNYAQRSGSVPTFNSAIGSMADRPFQMNVTIQQASVIKNVLCSSGHSISVSLGASAPDPDHNFQPSHFASVALVDCPGFLTEDVVLVISAAGLGNSRCFIESHPSSGHDTAALALSLVPDFNLPDIPVEMEYVFLVDLSGSMEGENIQLVREALVILLRSLPASGTTFNILSVGSDSTKLWEASQAYSRETLKEATNYVDSMQANHGRTEFASAFHLVDESLAYPLRGPVSVFVLTDSAELEVYSSILHRGRPKKNLRMFEDTRYRMFTLSIGSQAPGDMGRSIALSIGRQNDMILYVKQGETLAGKCLSLLRAAWTIGAPEVKLEVFWGMNEDEGLETKLSGNPPSLVSSSVNLNTPTVPLLLRIQQSPIAIPDILPGKEAQLYAIICSPDMSEKASDIETVKIKGTVVSTDHLVEVEVPISKICSPSLINGSSTPGITHFPFLHTLAAKALIADREEGKFPVHTSASFGNIDHAKLDVVRLGTEYGLASKYTRFIGSDHREKKINLVKAQTHFIFGLPSPVREPAVPSRPPAPLFFPTSVSSSPFAYSTLGEFRTFSLNPNTGLSTFSSAELFGLQPAAALLDSFDSTSTDTKMSPSALLVAVARLQQWDGGFQLSSRLLDLLRHADNFSNNQLLEMGADALGAKFVEHGIVRRDIGATLIAVLWMEKSDMEDVEEVSFGMKKKAEKWMESALGGIEGKMRELKDIVLNMLALT